MRVFARNAAGNSALSTNQVQITVGGAAPPGRADAEHAHRVGNNVGLSWAPGAGGTPTSYTLGRRAQSGGAPIVTVPGLTGTAIAFARVPSGTYFLRLVATNALGSSPPSNEVTLVVPCSRAEL